MSLIDKLQKRYASKKFDASRKLSDEQLESLRQGVELDDGITRPAVVVHLRNSATSTFLEITITEGRNRQVRRMFEASDHPVTSLVRLRFGPIALADLRAGHWRHATGREVAALRRLGAAAP